MATAVKPLKVNKNSLPKQTQQYIRNLIADGAYQPGCKLPAEGDLAEQLGISRPTLREALQNLETQGVILRKRGVGTFVAPLHPWQLETGLETLESIDRTAARRGLNAQMGQTEIVERPADVYEAGKLGLSSGDGVIYVSRIMLIDHLPVAYLTDVLPAEPFQKEEFQNIFTGSVLDVLLKRGRNSPAYSFTSLDALPADGQLANWLGIQRGSPLLRLESVLYSQEGQVIDLSLSHFVPGYFQFLVLRQIEKKTSVG